MRSPDLCTDEGSTRVSAYVARVSNKNSVSCGLCFGSIVDEHDDAHAGQRTSIAKKETRTNQRKKLSMGKTSLW